MNNIENIVAAPSIAAALNDGQTFANHPSHVWDWEFGRCAYCDCRPFGRHAPHPCQ